MVTLDMIAKKCGVSKMTVSRALGPQSHLVATEKLQEVLKVADSLNYRRNTLANSLNTGRTQLIAYLGSEFRHFQSAVFSGILSALVAEEYDVLTLKWSKTLKSGDRLLKSIVDRRVEGVMLFHEGPGCDYSYLEDFQKHNTPVVVLDRDVNISGMGYVGLDNYNGAIEATDHLLDLGHKSILFVSREEDWGYSTTSDRYAGYKNALDKRRIQTTAPVIIPTEIINSTRYSEIESCIRPHSTTAIIANNDVVASICMLGLSEKGYRIPQDISVIGFGNIKGYTDMIRPALTTMDLNPRKIGIEASKLLLKMIADKHAGNTKDASYKVVLPMTLVIRDSTAKL